MIPAATCAIAAGKQQVLRFAQDGQSLFSQADSFLFGQDDARATP